MTQHADNPPLQGVTVCYVSVGGFGGVWRTWKQARSVVEAGGRAVMVGYADVMPAGFSDSGFEIIQVPRPEAPQPPELAPPPTPPEVPEWPSSSNPVALIRAVENRTVNRWRHDRALREYAVAVNEFHEAESAREQAYEQALRAHEEATVRYQEMLALPFFDAGANPGLIRAAIDARPTIVQAVDLPALDCASAAAESLGARRVYAAHELWAGFVRNPDSTADPSTAEGLLALERRFIGDVDLVTVVSDQMGERLVALYDIPTPLTLFNAPPTRVESARPVSKPVRLVFHGGLSSDRNLDGLIRAIALIPGAVALDIHGMDRTVEASTLQGLVDELGLTASVRFHGPFAYHGVVDLIRDYDVGVVSAKVVEESFEIALPNKVFDCMCAGLAIAMYDSPAIKALLEAVPFGICIDPSTPESIARDLGALVSDPERINRMKAAAVEASPRYWWPEQGGKLVDALTKMRAPQESHPHGLHPQQ